MSAEEMLAEIEAVIALHVCDCIDPSVEMSWCLTCDVEWPCPTVEALLAFHDRAEGANTQSMNTGDA